MWQKDALKKLKHKSYITKFNRGSGENRLSDH